MSGLPRVRWNGGDGHAIVVEELGLEEVDCISNKHSGGVDFLRAVLLVRNQGYGGRVHKKNHARTFIGIFIFALFEDQTMLY